MDSLTKKLTEGQGAFCDCEAKGHTFAPSTREALAAQIAKDEYDAIMSGEYGEI